MSGGKDLAQLEARFEAELAAIRAEVRIERTPDAVAPTLGHMAVRNVAMAPTEVATDAPTHAATNAPLMAVAFSGGLDSSVLLHLAARHAARKGVVLHAFHVHHGLSRNADGWLAHCRRESEQLGAIFAARRVQLGDGGKAGLEAVARASRYAALGALCREHGIGLLLTAHHQDDQAETVLLQLLRGAGMAGMSGMERANTAPALLGDARLVMARPLLSVPRADLQRFAEKGKIPFVEDESNLDPRHARNALRHLVMPALSQHFPGFQQRLARSAGHAQSAQRLLDGLACQDLSNCLAPGRPDCLDLAQLRRLDPERCANLLRHWFASRGVRMPSTSWLQEMRTQLLDARADAMPCVGHPDCDLRRHRDRLYLLPPQAGAGWPPSPVPFRWRGEAALRFDGFGGTLHFEPADGQVDGAGWGVASAWLLAQSLTLHVRSGGERLKPAANRPTRSLKHHCQALGIPPWERERLPIVSAGPRLLYAAGIGMDCSLPDCGGPDQVRLRWQPGPIAPPL